MEAARRRIRLALAAAINGVGAATTGIVAIEVAISKLRSAPGWCWYSSRSDRHHVVGQTALHASGSAAAETPWCRGVVVRTVVPVAELGVPARQALAYAQLWRQMMRTWSPST